MKQYIRKSNHKDKNFTCTESTNTQEKRNIKIKILTVMNESMNT